MLLADGFGPLIGMLALFGSIAGIIVARGWSKAECIRAEAQAGRQTAPASQEAVLTELKALKQQMSEMQSTGHQFDLSFDAALNRLEGRVDRLETKTAASTMTANAMDAPQSLRNGTTP